MLSDTLFESTQEIERYQAQKPDIYDGWRDHIEIVKQVMGWLREVLDGPPEALLPNVADALPDDMKEYWRACCEAGLSRWVERLRLLGPITPEELAGRLGGAVERFNALLVTPLPDPGLWHSRRMFLDCLHVWQFSGDVEPVRGRLVAVSESLEHDTHPLVVDYADWLQLPSGATFADGVRSVRVKLQPTDAEATRREVFRLASECWDGDATGVVHDAVVDKLDDPICAHELIAAVVEHSDFWLEQFACAAFGLPPCEDGEYGNESLLSEGRKALAARGRAAGLEDGQR